MSNRSVFFEALYAAALSLCCLSCSLVSWEYLDISSNVPDGGSFFAGEFLELNFSRAPDIHEIERLAQLKTSEGPAALEMELSGGRLRLRPQSLWRRGLFYTFSLEGSLRLSDGRYNTVRFERHFYYGSETDTFTLFTAAPPAPGAGAPLVFVFSRPVNIPSFTEKFTLSPYTETRFFFTEDDAAVWVTPQNAWPANTVFTWKIAGMQSKDGVSMAREYTGFFYTTEDTSIPELLTVCPVLYDPPPALWKKSLDIDGKLMEKDAIGFIFSKPMDVNSVYSGIALSPALPGYFVQESDTQFIFIPESTYEIKKEYRLTAAKSIMCKNGISLFEEKTYFFTAAASFLAVDSITPNLGAAMVLSDQIVAGVKLESDNKLIMTITFSSAIPERLRQKAVDSISLDALFPLSAGVPALFSAVWTSPYAVTLTWDSLSKSESIIKYYYSLTVKSGKNNVINEAGEYLKEDVCVHFCTE